MPHLITTQRSASRAKGRALPISNLAGLSMWRLHVATSEADQLRTWHQFDVARQEARVAHIVLHNVPKGAANGIRLIAAALEVGDEWPGRMRGHTEGGRQPLRKAATSYCPFIAPCLL
jgi:hypothetical protein